MKPRIKDRLEDFGYAGTAADFRAALIAVKAEHYGAWDIEELTHTKNQAADCCALVRKRLDCPKLPHVFILRNLVNCRKNGLLARKRSVSAGATGPVVASSPDGQAAK